MKREDLTPRQLEVVDATQRVVLVVGGPGTGKTTVALWAARDELSRPGGAPWQRVLFLTFSRTAVGQIAKRAPDVFEASGADRIEISTFHGFAWRLIRSLGRYAGYGAAEPVLQSEAQAKLFGRSRGQMRYEDLLPAVRRLLTSERLRELLARRWPLVICDEFQDTDNDQWALLTTLGAHARLLLLADPNQMIYGFLREKGVSPERLDHARRIADREIHLETHSHRDPSGTIPAMAEAVRSRDFDHEAVLHTVRTGRLTVLPNIEDEDLPKVIAGEVYRLRAAGANSVGIFGHSNEGVATLGFTLWQIGLDHVLVGIPEAHGEALIVLATLCAFGVGLASSEEVRAALATFLTACTRGRTAPALAVLLAQGGHLPGRLEERLKNLEEALQETGDGAMGDLVSVAARGWEAIGITSGVQPWRRACADFAGVTRKLAPLPASQENVRFVMAEAERRRPGALVEFDATKIGPVQLMNFHQTKGREADAVLLVYRTGDYLADAREAEPYEEASRVLFVALTRARNYVVVILPREPHPLVAPFMRLL